VRGTPVTDWDQGFTVPMMSSELAMEIISTKQTIAFNPTGLDELKDKYPVFEIFYEAGLRSFLGSPLVVNDQVIGIITLISAEIGAYTNHEAALLQRISNQIAGSIASESLFKLERERTKQLEALIAVSAIMSQPLNFEAKCRAIVEKLVDTTDVSFLYLRRAKRD